LNRLAACLVTFVAALVVPALAAAQTAPLIVQNAWMRKVPGADTAAVYLVLKNTGVQPVIVVAVRSPLASNVMIHETSTVGGQSQMRMHEKLIVAPGKTMALQPGGLHVMLSGFKKSPLIGQTVPLVLVLSNGETVPVAVVVRSLGAQ
jgi:periplasmic copper chaperone A